MNKRVIPHLLALLTMFIWGMTFVCTKVVLQSLTPLESLLSRAVLAFIALCVISPHIMRTKSWRDELLFAAAGLTGSFGYFMAENTALQYADASFVSIAVSVAPLFTAALGFVVLHEKGFGPRYVIGFVIAISGIALVCSQEGPAHASVVGLGLSFLGAAIWAVYSIIVKHLSEKGYETIPMTKRTFAWGLVFMIVVRAAQGTPYPFEAYANPVVLGNLAFLGFFASALCFVTWGYCVKHLGTAAASAYIYLQAPLTVVDAVIILGEPLTVGIVVGIALTIVGLALSEGYDQVVRDALRRT